MKALGGNIQSTLYKSNRSQSNLIELQKQFSSLQNSRIQQKNFSIIIQSMSKQDQPALPLDRINRSKNILRSGQLMYILYSEYKQIRAQHFKIVKDQHQTMHSHRQKSNRLQTQMSLTIQQNQQSRAYQIRQRIRKRARKILSNQKISKLMKHIMSQALKTRGNQMMSYGQYLQFNHFQYQTQAQGKKYPPKRKRFMPYDDQPVLQGKWQINQMQPVRAKYRSKRIMQVIATRLNSKKKYRVFYSSGKLQCSSITILSKPFACALKDAKIVDQKSIDICGKILQFDDITAFKELAIQQALRKSKMAMLREGTLINSVIWYCQGQNNNILEMDKFQYVQIFHPILKFNLKDIVVLSVSGCFQSEQGLQQLLQAISQKETLTKLDISNNPVSQKSSKLYFSIIAKNKQISDILLSKCKLRYIDKNILSDLKKRDWNQIDISSNPISQKLVLSLVQKVVLKAQSIFSLNLSWIAISQSLGLNILSLCGQVNTLILNHCLRLTSSFIKKIQNIISQTMLKNIQLIPRQGKTNFCQLLKALEQCITLQSILISGQIQYPQLSNASSSFLII